MGGAAAELTVLGHGLAAAAHVALLVHLWRTGYARTARDATAPTDDGAAGQGSARQAARAFMLAVGLGAAWAALGVLEILTRAVAPAHALTFADIARHAAWFAFVLLALRPALRASTNPVVRRLGIAAALIVAAALAAWAARLITGRHETTAAGAHVATSLATAVFGLLLVEQLFRNLPEDSRWNAKPLCLGLAVAWVYDLYLFSEALLFGRLDADVLAMRGAAHLLAVPLLFVASLRRADWMGRLQFSRSAAFYSTTLLLVGAYLLFMAGVGYYVRYFGGDWGRALQIGLLVAAIAMLAVLLFSGSWRARVRVFVGKHFFSYRYDYRKEWLRFTTMLSRGDRPAAVAEQVIRGLASMVESPGGGLWMRSGAEAALRQRARWNVPAVTEAEAESSDLCRFLARQGWVVDLDEYRSAPRRYGQIALPGWLVTSPGTWLVVPLMVGETLSGFVTLARPRTPMEPDWEVRDLLKTASRQAAVFLAQMDATEALLEARKFDAFNRMSAFVVHDLKNIVTQLSLMLKNAQRLHGNPEFQQDMLSTVESSLEKMRRLMLQLREGAAPSGGTLGVELAPILRRLAAMAEARGRRLAVDAPEGLATRGHDERLERVLGHMVHNALDATPPEGRVWARASRASGQVKVEIGDTGVGMTEEFVKTRLFRPFSSTKASGMGIGSFESLQYIRELGGSIDVVSAPGRGTVVTMLLPLFDTTASSDARRALQA